MKNIYAITVFSTCLIGCTFTGSEVNTNKNNQLTETDISRLVIEKETAALTNWANADLVGYTINFDSTASYVDDIFAQERLDGLDNIRAYFTRLDSMELIGKHTFEIVDPRVQVYGNVAILNFQHHAYESDGTVSPVWKSTVVYALRNEDWKVVHANWSQFSCQ